MEKIHRGLSNRPQPSSTDMAGKDARHPNPSNNQQGYHMFLFCRCLGSQKRKRMEKGSLQVLLGNIHPRIVPVVDTDASKFRSSGCQSLSILVEHDVSLGLDELKRRQSFGLVGMKACQVVGIPNHSKHKDKQNAPCTAYKPCIPHPIPNSSPAT